MQSPGGPGGPRTRRELLKMAPLAAAGLLLSDTGRRWALRSGLAMSDAAAVATFRPGALAPTFADRDVTPLARFPVNSYLVDDPEVDLDGWSLDVSGLVARPAALTLDALRRLPKVVQNTRHLCIEGWDVIGNFGGVAMAGLLEHVGAARDAGFLDVRCADDVAAHPLRNE